MNRRLDQHIEEERTWIEQSKTNIKAFEPLYNKYYDLIFRYLLRRTDDDMLAADLCSQTFYKALSNIKKFKWQGIPLAPWLYQIASNELKKHYRDKKPIYVIEEDIIETKEELSDRWVQLIESNKLTEVLNRLNEQEVQLIELRYFEELTFDEIAIIMEMKLSAVKMKLYRLLNKLKSNLEDNVEI
ncbi:MAG: RNA polymerase [Flammeovirgaceae bacterium]|nr:RNA polymerase [Flammeovirgaceae bacterium]MBE63342.1 RNA polymerase [Flammeovirgaceae bacterium]|tara:strand:- start:275 stop:832 length:558 start_codon:yes stop_codon:yes gene_type:complete